MTMRNFAGLQVFLAEDEFHVLQLIESVLLDLGCKVTDTVSSLPAALSRAVETEAQIAVLDVNLHGQLVYPAARILRDRRIPILFSTGYGGGGLQADWKTESVIQKPFAIGRMEAALAELLSTRKESI
jgi:CheY-like chemotaxis protein